MNLVKLTFATFTFFSYCSAAALNCQALRFMPDQVKCGPFSEIDQESYSTPKGVFCRAYLQVLCTHNLNLTSLPFGTHLDWQLRDFICAADKPLVLHTDMGLGQYVSMLINNLCIRLRRDIPFSRVGFRNFRGFID